MSKKWKIKITCHCLCKRNLSKICKLLSNLKRHLSKPIFIDYNVMCSLISYCCCNHLNSMLMSVKLIMIQLELNGIGYKLVFHSYSKSTSNTWYTLICKFENINQTPKNYMGMNIYSILDFLEIGIFLEIRNKRSRKRNFILWNFEDQKEWKNREKTKEMFRENMIKINK